MRKFWKYLFRILLILVVVVLLLPFLVYIPAIQGYIKEKAVDYMVTHLDMKAHVNHLSLKFPLRLELDGVYVGRTDTDTLLYAKRLTLDIGIKRIFRKELDVKDLSLSDVRMHLIDDTTGMQLHIGLSHLAVTVPAVYLKEHRMENIQAGVTGAEVILIPAMIPAQPDTLPSKPLDWSFGVSRIVMQRVTYRMSSTAIPQLQARVDSAEVVKGIVALGGQKVVVDSVAVVGGMCNILTASSSEKIDTIKESTTDSSLWTIRAGAVLLGNYAFQMDSEVEKKVELNLTNIGIRIDSVYNRGSEIKANLMNLKVVRQEGGQIDSMQAVINLQPELTQVRGVYMRTPNSLLRLNVLSETGITDIGKGASVKADLSASIGLKDMALFVNNIPAELKPKVVSVRTELTYRENGLVIKRLNASMPDYFTINATGNLSNWRPFTAVSGQIHMEGDFKNISFLDTLLGQGITIPRDLQLSGKVDAMRGHIAPDIQIYQGQGKLAVSGYYNLPKQKYDLYLKADRFAVDRFLPVDSLGMFTAEVQVNGQYLNIVELNAHATVEIEELEYKSHVYKDLRLAATMDSMRLSGDLQSDDPALLFHLNFRADSVDRQYTAAIEGEVGNIDLKELHFSATDLAVATKVNIKAAMVRPDDYFLNAAFDGIRLDEGRGYYDLGNLTIDLSSDRKHTNLDVRSGDFRLAFRSDTTITGLVRQYTNTATEIQRQIDERQTNMEKIQPLLPDFYLDIKGNRGNIIGQYLKSRNIVFRSMHLNASSSAEGVYMTANINHPVAGKVEFDSVNFQLQQQQRALKYEMQLMNPQGIVKDLYLVNLSGNVVNDSLNILLYQENEKRETGINIGAGLIFADSAFVLRLYPVTPMLGYTSWAVNPENQIIFYKDRRIKANLQLGYQNKMLSIHSLSTEGEAKDRLRLQTKGINLAAVSSMTPFVPDLNGILNTDLQFYSDKGYLAVNGEVVIDSFYYNAQRIGDLKLDLSYNAQNRLTEHAVEFDVLLDDLKRMSAKGRFMTEPDKEDLELDLDIPSLPLYLMNAFVSPDMVRLSGSLQGHLYMKGIPDHPDINGQLIFQEANAEVVPLGTHFRIGAIPISIEKGRIVFQHLDITAPNRQVMQINGNLFLTPFSDMHMDLTLMAKNFQIVNVKSNPTSWVYGKAYADMGISLKGPFSALSLNGGINLLDNTGLTYVLRSSAPELKNRSVDLVRFVSFQDTMFLQQDNSVNRFQTSSFSMKLLVEIGQAVNMNIYLSEDGNNQVSIQGGGNLIFSMNPESGNNLVGKYTLTGGMVRYNVPIVGEKNFTIRSGSYMEWTGNLADPILNITANESVKVSVTEDNQSSRIVNFDVLIRIENHLEQPKIVFDLEAPSDQAMQTQLTAFSQEERTKQAMNLLIYGTYSGPGTINTGTNANNTLNNFVEKELNQWTRKYLKNSGLTFGIDTYNQIGAGGQEVKRTDYSYQFSKQLFNDRINVKVGGRISSDNDPGTSMEDNLIDDIAIEYRFTEKRDLFLKIFRHTNYESVLEGEVTQTGVGVVWRKNFRKVKDLFRFRKKKEKENVR